MTVTDFLTVIRHAEIKAVIDIQWTPLSRKAGFSKKRWADGLRTFARIPSDMLKNLRIEQERTLG